MKKKIDKEAEKELLRWIEEAKQKGESMDAIVKVLEKKHKKKDVKKFLEKNFKEYLEEKERKALDENLTDDRNKKEAIDNIDEEMNNLLSESKGEEPPKKEEPIEQPAPQAQEPQPQAEQEQKEIPIQRMSTYDIELLNQIASINQGIMKIVELLSKK